MPELPEVEVTRRSFAQRIAGSRIERMDMGKPLRWPLGCAPEDLVGRRVESVGRRGKYLLVHLDQGVLLVHLGMSGSLQFASGLPPRGVHDHLELRTSQGTLRLHDPRRFGAVVHVDSLEDPRARKLLDGLGVEPLEGDFEPLAFYRGLKLRRASIKQVLLAGDLVVGVGNIYASEALWLSKLRPTKRAGRLTEEKATILAKAIDEVLRTSLANHGTSLRDFVDGDGAEGSNYDYLKVYDRKGQPCPRCKTSIRRSVLQGRATYFCPTCQTP